MRTKTILKTLLVLALVLCAFRLSATKAQAATHSHPVCGTSCACASDDHSSATWTAWDGTTKLMNGDYYLTKDLVLDSTMIMDYNYTTRLCLNGHSITCEDRVFDIYSYRSLLITDCVGTGKVETTGDDCTIGNNKYLSVWGGTILNSGDGPAVYSYNGTTTYICGGRVEVSNDWEAIYCYPGSKVYVQGGTVYGGGYAINGNGQSGNQGGSLNISGGTITCEYVQQYPLNSSIGVQDGNFLMSGGYVEGSVEIYEDSSSTVTVSGGTITGNFSPSADASITLSGGRINGLYLSGNVTISGGTFTGNVYLYQDSAVTVTGGDLSGTDIVYVAGTAHLSGGTFGPVEVTTGTLHLSGTPKIDALTVRNKSSVCAQDPDCTTSYTGDPIPVTLYYDSTWSDGNIIITNVTSDAVAERFLLQENGRYLTRSGNNMVLRILPHGTCGNDATWILRDGILTISGTGAITYCYSGHEYPWGDYLDQITGIVVEEGITQIPSYTFEYCEEVTSITLPDTLTTLALNAFNDCGKLEHLLLPASLTTITGSSNTGYPAFIRCESLTDVYYLGTAEEWARIPDSDRIDSHDSEMTLHFLQLHEATATCTTAGTESYYQFDDTSVYPGMYDLDKQPIEQPATAPALGHRVVGEGLISVDPIIVDNTDAVPFQLTNGTWYSNNHAASSSSELKITAQYACTLTLNYGVSSEASYDKLYILLNGTQKAAISGSVTNETMTLTLTAGDEIIVRYTKDGSVDSDQDQGWVSLVYEQVSVMGRTDISTDTLEPDCTNAVTCDYCQTVVKPALGHRVSVLQSVTVDPLTVTNSSAVPFTLTDGTWYSNNHDHSSSSQITVTADYDCTLTLRYGVSSETNYDKLYILLNGTQKTYISGTPTDQTMTLSLTAGDQVIIRYSKDSSVSRNDDRGWVTLVYEQVTITESTDVSTDGLEPDCVNAIICDYCGTEAIPATGHSYESTVTPPTCTDGGSTTHTCTACGDTYTDAPTEATGHGYRVVTTPPTCTQDGTTDYVCEVCGDTIPVSTEPATGHSYESVVIPPTCTENGFTTHTCTACGDSYTDTPTDTTPHPYEAVVTAPSCTEAGFTTFTCTVCGDSYTGEETAATGHDYGQAITPPTCTESGFTTFTCTVCGDSYTGEATEATGHDYAQAITPPTCTESGFTTFTCTVCGDSYTGEATEATGHDYAQAITPPTCTESGFTTFTCTVCGDSYTGEATETTGHIYEQAITPPTCTADGNIANVCTVCGHTVITDTIYATGHSYEAVITAPTCTEPGHTTHTCTACGDSYVDTPTDATGHIYVDGKCVCGKISLTAPSITSCYSRVQTSVKVTWAPVGSAEGYQLFRSSTPDDPDSWSCVKTITGNTTVYTNHGLTLGVTYYYKIRAFATDASGKRVWSDFSNVDYMPAAVVFNDPYSNSTSRIRLRWHEISGAHGYQIWRQLDDGSWAIVKTLGDRGNTLTNDQGHITAYSNTGLVSGQRYTYKMRAFMITEDGRKIYGAYSDEFTVAVIPENPEITVTLPKPGRAAISWNEISGADGYQIWMQGPDGTWQIAKSVVDGSTAYTKYDLQSGKEYRFKVRAYTDVNGKKTFSEYSQEITVTIL